MHNRVRVLQVQAQTHVDTHARTHTCTHTQHTCAHTSKHTHNSVCPCTYVWTFRTFQSMRTSLLVVILCTQDNTRE